MVAELKRLTPDQLDMINKAPILVSILIAGADGTIDRNEIKGAIETAKKRSRGKSSLQTFYKEVGIDFEDKLKVILQTYPASTEERGTVISDELAQLNDIFKLVEGSLARDIYDSLKSLALNIAKSSGGFFGLFSSIGPEEAKYVDLKMIAPPSSNQVNVA
jgi:hypothetical protein